MLRVILADVAPKHLPKPKAEEHFAELLRLVETLGGMTVVQVIQKRGRPSGATWIGTGKADEVGALAKELKVDAVIINGILKGRQLLELESRIPTKVWDRVDVILKIFEKNARTAEAKLQVQKARLLYDIPKIYRRSATTLFERERGGGVTQRGAGETGIEAEKRHIKENIRRIDAKIAEVTKQRDQQRKSRRRAGLRTVAIVGYTNAGKSSLLRALTGKKVLIEDKLFATLDVRIGELWLPNLGQKVLLADTIGFIQELPPQLIDAFKSTLEEANQADLLLQVWDATEPPREQTKKKKVVAEILEQLGAGEIPVIAVANKIDALSPARQAQLAKRKNIIAVSAVDRIGFAELAAAIEQALQRH